MPTATGVLDQITYNSAQFTCIDLNLTDEGNQDSSAKLFSDQIVVNNGSTLQVLAMWDAMAS